MEPRIAPPKGIPFLNFAIETEKPENIKKAKQLTDELCATTRGGALSPDSALAQVLPFLDTDPDQWKETPERQRFRTPDRDLEVFFDFLSLTPGRWIKKVRKPTAKKPIEPKRTAVPTVDSTIGLPIKVAYEIATSPRYKKPLTVELLKEIITQHPKLRIVKAGPRELRLARKDLSSSTSKPQVKRFSTKALLAS